MLPWSDKGGGASSSSSSTLRRDENIASSSQYRSQSSNADSSRFRSQQQQAQQVPLDQGFDTFGSNSSNNPLGFNSMHHPQQGSRFINNQAPPLPEHNINDGADIQAFLNSTAYSDEVYGDDLVPDSTAYLSHRHQVDHHHSMAEQQRLHQWQDLLQAEDIVAYLQEMRYTDDIYGAPPLVEELIKEAQKEVTQEDSYHQGNTDQNRTTAIQRLTMVRDHLMAEARGNVETAIKQSQQLQQDDWEQIFSRGSVL
ncbi:hypothetical protein BDA99DRAFT_560315 [Phascolomyces articulosus]|uniref:Uncharacterized protein n=1 Tax=Phascolomyces articulosus TaxID=60185 RepID=A0AAD5JZ06_9FUNG|nr:hypothetical protein BDA99DRAFT_560315 [Phascolomyces articulosus]